LAPVDVFVEDVITRWAWGSHWRPRMQQYITWYTHHHRSKKKFVYQKKISRFFDTSYLIRRSMQISTLG
jgi:hypothetical protein